MIGSISRPCCGIEMVAVSTEKGGLAKINVLVVCGRPLRFYLLLGIEDIKALGGIAVGPLGQIQISDGQGTKCATITINEPDFTATFDHQSRAWTQSKDSVPEGLHIGVLVYPTVAEIQEECEWKLRMWMSYSWLVPYPEEKLGLPKRLIPLIAILQQNKSKVCPVMDFQELNHHVEVFTTNTDVCAAKLHEWWRKGSNVSLLEKCISRYMSTSYCGHSRLCKLTVKDAA